MTPRQRYYRKNKKKLLEESRARYHQNIAKEHESFQKCWTLENLRLLSSRQNYLDGNSKVRHKEEK